MTGLLDFLRARLDDDEEVASDAAGLGASRRHWTRDAISCVVDAADNGLIVYGEGKPTSEQADHIARHDPDRVLREVEAKRRILDLHSVDHECSTIRRGIDCVGEPYEEINNCTWVVDEDCSTVRLLALPFDQHPDYREEWKP